MAHRGIHLRSIAVRRPLPEGFPFNVPVSYDELEHVRITKGFLNHPERYLARLFE